MLKTGAWDFIYHAMTCRSCQLYRLGLAIVLGLMGIMWMIGGA